MRKRLLGVVRAALIVGGIAAPASARKDETITWVCSNDGQTTLVTIVDANAFFGATTSNLHYNEVNPFGEVCEIV